MTTNLDRRLTDALRGDALDAPMPDGLLQVPDGWVRTGRAAGLARGLAAVGVVGAAVLTTMVVIALVNGGLGPIRIGNPGAGTGVEIRNVDTEPRVPAWVDPAWPAAGGPVVEMVRGSADDRWFTFTVYRSESGDACVGMQWGRSEAPSCGWSLPGTTRHSQWFGTGASSSGSVLPHAVYGLVDSEVATVSIETSTGGSVATRLIGLDPAGIDASMFFAFLPGGSDGIAWIARDAAGAQLERLVVGVPDTEEPSIGPVPTPEAVGLTWIAVTGPADWVAPEPMSLVIGDTQWNADSGGVVSLDLAAGTDVRLIGLTTCTVYADVDVDSGETWVIRFDAAGHVGVEDWTGRGMDAGPGLGPDRRLWECELGG